MIGYMCVYIQDSDDDGDEDSAGDSEHEHRSADSQSVDSRSTVGGLDNRLSMSHSRNAAAATNTSATTSSAVAFSHARSTPGRRSRRRPVSEEWEILEGLKSGQQYELTAPQKFGGYIMKSR